MVKASMPGWFGKEEGNVLGIHNTGFLLWFGSGMTPKGSGVEGLVPSTTMFRDETFRKWLDHKGSDLISGMTVWRHYWEVGCRWKGGSLGECSRELHIVSLFPSSLSASWLSWAEQLSFTTLFYHDVQFEFGSRAKELANHGLEPLKHELN